MTAIFNASGTLMEMAVLAIVVASGKIEVWGESAGIGVHGDRRRQRHFGGLLALLQSQLSVLLGQVMVSSMGIVASTVAVVSNGGDTFLVAIMAVDLETDQSDIVNVGGGEVFPIDPGRRFGDCWQWR